MAWDSLGKHRLAHLRTVGTRPPLSAAHTPDEQQRAMTAAIHQQLLPVLIRES